MQLKIAQVQTDPTDTTSNECQRCDEHMHIQTNIQTSQLTSILKQIKIYETKGHPRRLRQGWEKQNDEEQPCAPIQVGKRCVRECHHQSSGCIKNVPGHARHIPVQNFPWRTLQAPKCTSKYYNLIQSLLDYSAYPRINTVVKITLKTCKLHVWDRHVLLKLRFPDGKCWLLMHVSANSNVELESLLRSVNLWDSRGILDSCGSRCAMVVFLSIATSVVARSVPVRRTIVTTQDTGMEWQQVEKLEQAQDDDECLDHFLWRVSNHTSHIKIQILVDVGAHQTRRCHSVRLDLDPTEIWTEEDSPPHLDQRKEWETRERFDCRSIM